MTDAERKKENGKKESRLNPFVMEILVYFGLLGLCGLGVAVVFVIYMFMSLTGMSSF